MGGILRGWRGKRGDLLTRPTLPRPDAATAKHGQQVTGFRVTVFRTFSATLFAGGANQLLAAAGSLDRAGCEDEP